MTKILKDSTYDELKSKAEAFDQIMAGVDVSDADVSIEEQANLIIGLMNEEDASENATQTEMIGALQSKIEELNATIVAHEATIVERNSRIDELEAELDEVPGDAPATITSKEESTARPYTLVDFADRNAGNTEAILSKLKEEGLL